MIEKFLEGKGALITGGASGFGRGVAYAFAERGADLVLVDINEELLEETTKKVAQKTGKKVIPIICDVSDSKQVKKMRDQAFNELDNVFVLFNNAGIAPGALMDIMRINETNFDSTIRVNLKGQWLIAKFIGRRMKNQKFEDTNLSGKIICNSSDAALTLPAELPAYALSKVGVVALAKLLAKALAPKITVNSIAPGIHPTGIYLNSVELIENMINGGNIKIPLDRIGTVEDIVNIVVFLTSPASDYITGQCFPVDGGLNLT